MAESLTPPQTINEIPEKLIAAWRALGAKIDDNLQQSLLSLWDTNQALNHRLTNTISSIVAQDIPADHWPAWNTAIWDLLKTQADDAKQKNIILLTMLSYFLDGANLLQLPALHDTIIQFQNIHRIAHFIPRHHDERERMAQALPRIADLNIARYMLSIMARDSAASSNAAKAQRDALIKRLLPELPIKIFEFKYERPHSGSGLASELVQDLHDPQLLEQLIQRGNRSLRLAVLSRYADLVKGRDWSPLMMEVLRAHPEDIEKAGLYNIDLPIIELLWDTTKNRRFAVERLFSLLDQAYDPDSREDLAHDADAYLAMLQRMLNEDAEPVVNIANGEDGSSGALSYLEIQPLYAIWQLQHSALMALFLPVLAYRFKHSPFVYEDDEDEDEDKAQAAKIRATLGLMAREVLSQQKQQFTEIKLGELAPLLKFIDSDALLENLSASLKPIAAKSKPVQQQLAQGLATVTPALLDKLGWINDKRKAVRTVALEALLLSAHAEAANYLYRLHSDAKLGDAEKERILARLEQLGANTEALETPDAETIEQLQALAANTKIKTTQIDKIWNEPLLQALTPLDETVGRWLLNLALESKDDPLPRLGKKALQHITAENRARLAEQLMQLWLAANGDRRLRWLMKFVPEGGDDRLVEPLFEAFKSWYKKAKPKAVFILETLGLLDTPYALAQVHEVYSNNSYSYTLNEAATQVLKTAAARRSIELLDLFDELTPDFGLKAEGLTLDAGPRSYTISVVADLSLRVRNDKTGKITKSLPKARVDEDADKRAVLQSAFQLLRRNLKKVAKQQAKRLQESLICNRRWPLPRWQTLFIEHPLLSLLAQGFIWQRWDAEGSRYESFRISEDHSLIQADDDIVQLHSSDHISLWHPVLDEEQSQSDWQTHIEDYSIKPLLEQTGLPRLMLSDDELQDNTIKRFSGVEVDQFIIKRYMESWNYQIDDQDGSWISGYSRRFPLLKMNVEIGTEGVQVYSFQGDTTKLEDIRFYSDDHEQVPLKDLPTTLIATILQQGEALRASH